MLSNPENTNSEILCEVKNLDAIDKKKRDAEEIDEKQILIRAQTRDKSLGFVVDPDPPWHPFPNQDFDVCRQLICDVKCKHTYDRDNSRISFASMNAEKANFLGERNNANLNLIVSKVLKKVTAIFTEKQFQVSTINIENAELQNSIKTETERVRVFLVEKDLQLKQSKIRPKRLPSFDKNNLETYIALPAEDIERSRHNVMLKVAVNRLKIQEITKVKDILTKDLEQLENEKAPLVEKLTDGLKSSVGDEILKDLKWSIEIIDDRIAFKTEQFSTLEIEVAGLSADRTNCEKKVAALNLVSDMNELPGKIENLKKRRRKLKERINSILADIEELEVYRQNVNTAWKDLVGSDKDICNPLCLKASAEIYIV